MLRFTLVAVVAVVVLASSADAVKCYFGTPSLATMTSMTCPSGDKCMAVGTTTNGASVGVASCSNSMSSCDTETETGSVKVKTCCCSGDDCNDKAFVEACSPAVTNAASLVLSLGMAWLVKMIAY